MFPFAQYSIHGEMAEWSKAPESGSGLSGREFESRSRHPTLFVVIALPSLRGLKGKVCEGTSRTRMS